MFIDNSESHSVRNLIYKSVRDAEHLSTVPCECAAIGIMPSGLLIIFHSSLATSTLNYSVSTLNYSVTVTNYSAHTMIYPVSPMNYPVSTTNYSVSAMNIQYLL